ncbi:oxidoreductase FAD-binding domain-containing protein [Phlyctema vagabunda]|uniref:Oxidoreductase FAD-binding domain-containing protein n=1 Tax=Phlyctema vagabunda TaxID=108571 RepID=A0ABR4P3Z8_9HELO
MPPTSLITRRFFLSIGTPASQSCCALSGTVLRRSQRQRYSKYNGTPRQPSRSTTTPNPSRRGPPRPSASGQPPRSNSGIQKFLLGFLGLAIVVPVTWYQFLAPTQDELRIFDPPRFTPFTIVAREQVSPTNVILTLRPATAPVESDPYISNWERGTWSVEFKQPELQIARSYTPLPPIASSQPGDLRFLIRKEHKGEVSSYLHGLSIGSNVQLRGPHSEVDLPKNVSDVLFLAGGTGIAPALQVAHTLLETRLVEEDALRIHIVWANRRWDECAGAKKLKPTASSLLWKAPEMPQEKIPPNALVRELEALQQKYPGHVTVDYVVDEEGTSIDQKRLMQLVKTNSEVKSQAQHERIDKRLLFVSGPEGFVGFLAGPKKWEDGKEGQGEIGGVIGKMRLRDWKVWKL